MAAVKSVVQVLPLKVSLSSNTFTMMTAAIRYICGDKMAAEVGNPPISSPLTA